MGILILLMVMTGLLLISIHNMRRFVLLRQRIEKIASPFYRGAREMMPSKQERMKKKYITSAKQILNYMNVLTAETTKEFTKKLSNAGWLSKNALIVFLSILLISIFAGIFFGFALILFVPSISGKPFILRAILLVLLMWLGYRLPEWYLSRKTKSYRAVLRKSILEFMDLYLICIEAGFSNDKSIERISNELMLLHPALCEQMKILSTELRILPNRRDAWDNFADRTGIDETKVVAQIIKQSEQLGASISQALRAQVEMFRSERLSYVEHKAMRLPILLTLPLVLFIFPALLLVILGPAIIRAMEVFGSGGS